MEYWTITGIAADTLTIYYDTFGDASDGIEIQFPSTDSKEIARLLAGNTEMNFLTYNNGNWSVNLDLLKSYRNYPFDWMHGQKMIVAVREGYDFRLRILP